MDKIIKNKGGHTILFSNGRVVLNDTVFCFLLDFDFKLSLIMKYGSLNSL